MEDKKFLFIDGNGYNCYEDELIYYVVLTDGGRYKVGCEFAEVISNNMAIWKTLIGLSLVRGIYKHKDKANEYCQDANFGSEKAINKVFFRNLI